MDPRRIFFGIAPGRAVENQAGTVSVRGFARYNVAVAFVIRDFQPEDFEILWRLDQECFPPGVAYSQQELRAYMRRRGAFTLVATESAKGKVAGFIVVHDGPTGHVITIDVEAQARRSGVGSQLLRAAEDRLRAERSPRRGAGNRR